MRNENDKNEKTLKLMDKMHKVQVIYGYASAVPIEITVNDMMVYCVFDINGARKTAMFDGEEILCETGDETVARIKRKERELMKLDGYMLRCFVEANFEEILRIILNKLDNFMKGAN